MSFNEIQNIMTWLKLCHREQFSQANACGAMWIGENTLTQHVQLIKAWILMCFSCDKKGFRSKRKWLMTLRHRHHHHHCHHPLHHQRTYDSIRATETTPQPPSSTRNTVNYIRANRKFLVFRNRFQARYSLLFRELFRVNHPNHHQSVRQERWMMSKLTGWCDSKVETKQSSNGICQSMAWSVFLFLCFLLCRTFEITLLRLARSRICVYASWPANIFNSFQPKGKEKPLEDEQRDPQSAYFSKPNEMHTKIEFRKKKTTKKTKLFTCDEILL